MIEKKCFKTQFSKVDLNRFDTFGSTTKGAFSLSIFSGIFIRRHVRVNQKGTKKCYFEDTIFESGAQFIRQF